MKHWQYGVAVGLLGGLGACSNMMGNSSHRTASTAQAAPAQPTVAPEMVKKVQAKLRDSGYYKQGAVDGVWGSQTESAVRSYQRDHNLGSSGQLNVATLQALNVTSAAPATTAGSPAASPATDATSPGTNVTNPANPNAPANPNLSTNPQPTTTSPSGAPADSTAAPPAR